MKIENINITDIKPYKNNPRKNDKAIEKVAESIRLFGFKNPVILDKHNVIVCGHTRVKAAEKLGIKTIPCIYADDLSNEQIKAFRLIDNKTAEYAQWDFNALAIEIKDIAENIDLDLSIFDFDIQLDTKDLSMPSFDELEKNKTAFNDDKVIIQITFNTYKEFEKEIDKIRDFIKPMGAIVTIK